MEVTRAGSQPFLTAACGRITREAGPAEEIRPDW